MTTNTRPAANIRPAPATSTRAPDPVGMRRQPQRDAVPERQGQQQPDFTRGQPDLDQVQRDDHGEAAVRAQPQGPHREQDRDIAPRVHCRGGRRQAAMPATPSTGGRIVPNA